MSEKENPLELRLDQVLAEYMSQCDSGEIPDREKFLEDHPDLREHLTELLSAADWIEEMAGPKIGDLATDSGLGPKTIAVNEDPGDTLPHFGTVQQSLDSETLDGLGKKKVLTDSDQRLAEDKRKVDVSQPILPCQFGDYVLERVLGRGGMGVVYQGRQSKLDRPVAVKMIRSGALASEEEVERFYAEARSAAQLQHPNIVTVYQCGEQDGHRFFSMDYVPGTDLSQMISEGPVDVRRAARYVRDVARAIQYAHDRGILHRDLKPANILVDDNGTVRITDFGLAKSIGTDTGLTAEGAALGTPSYMSPEQAAGKSEEQHHATDVYSLGAILFTLVTGQPPFKANTVVETIMHVIHRPAPRARSIAPQVHSDIETVIDVCLQKAPERRYGSAGELADDLDRFLQGSPIEARPMSKARRAWYWLLGVPIFGAVLDNRVVEPTDAHRWVQRGLISVALLLLASWMATLLPSGIYRNRMPSRVRVASGLAGGSYDMVAKSICRVLGEESGCNAYPISTEGSGENVERLENGEADLALLQADVIGSPSVAVIAPLYYEAVHVFVRKDAGIRELEQLKNRKVNIGGKKAGSRHVAELVLDRAGLTLSDVNAVTFDWHALNKKVSKQDDELQDDKTRGSPESEISSQSSSVDQLSSSESDSALGRNFEEDEEIDTNVDAAIIVSRLGSSDVIDILCEGEFELLGMRDTLQFALDEPQFRPFNITKLHYPDCPLPQEGVATVAMTAFLAAKQDTPSILVQTVLKHLFAPETVATLGIVSAERAAHWSGLVWHPAARAFFQPYQSESPKPGSTVRE